MKIQDLSKELDTKTMSAVTGGDNGNSASNIIGQESKIYVPVMVGATGPANTMVHVDGTQNASIGNGQIAGDSFLALLPSFSSIL